MFFDNGMFNASIIVSDDRDFSEVSAMNFLITHLPSYRILGNSEFEDEVSVNSMMDVARSQIRASDVGRISRKAIVIGNPCDNVWAYRLMAGGSCGSVFERDSGVVRLFWLDGFPVLLVSGFDGGMVFESMKYLYTSPHWNVEKMEVRRERYTYGLGVVEERVLRDSKVVRSIGYDFRSVGLTRNGATYVSQKKPLVIGRVKG